MVEFSELIGKVLLRVAGLAPESDRVEFHCTDGSAYVLYHAQDCCEFVRIVDVEGDVADITNTPIINARIATSEYFNELRLFPLENSDDGHSETWTFYKIDTAKGGVFIRWLGESNGYYSESVDFDTL